MKILCVGDVVGDPGVEFFCKRMPALRREYGADVVLVNGENAHESGKGITRAIADELFCHGADVITGGNHSFDKASDELFEETEYLLCPANFPDVAPAAGSCVLDLGRYAVQVISLSGVAFMEPVRPPFEVAKSLLAGSSARFRLIDFHAESTAEKQALAYYLDGSVSAVFGTHTHVPTADGRVLPKGTGYLSDLGMTGPVESVIGVQPELAVKKQSTHRPVRFSVAKGPCRLDAALFTLDDATGRCTAVERFSEFE